MTAYQKAILYGPGDLRLEEDTLDTGHLAPDEVWVQTTVSALKIGTDRGNYEGAERVPGAPDYPRGVGDSNFGIVRGVGSAVKHLAVGDRVISGTWHQSMYIMQAGEDPAKVPDGADPEDAVYGNLYALSALCYHKALFRPGETVAVVGLGTLGLGAVALGPLFGARTVALGNSDIRLQAARTMGAHEALMSDDPDLHAKLDRFSDGRGIDLVILTANPWPAYKTSLEIVRRDGRVAIVSLLGRGEDDLRLQSTGDAALLRQGGDADRRQRRRSQPVSATGGTVGRGRGHAPPSAARAAAHGRRRAPAEQADHPSAALHRDAAGVRHGVQAGQDDDERRLRLERRLIGGPGC